MSFLNPILLFGTLAISVPIIIHLLNKRKVQRVWWGAMRFLQMAIEKNQRKLRIEDLLLLLLRCALVGLLALTLARPTLGGSGLASILGQSHVTAILAIDTSASMSGTDGARSRIELAREAATKLLDTLPGGTRVAVWAVSDTVEPLIPEPTSDLNLVRRTIAELPLTDRASNLAPAVSQAVTTLQKVRGGTKELFILTDAQRLAFSEIDNINRLLGGGGGGGGDRAETGADLHATFLFVGTDISGNLSVSELRASSGISPVGRQLRYFATITNHGLSEARDVRVLLRVDTDLDMKSPPIDESVIDSLPPGQSKSVSLYARLASPGPHAVRAEIAGAGVASSPAPATADGGGAPSPAADSTTGGGGGGGGGGDRIPVDNERTIVTRAVDHVRILLVDGNPGPEPRAAQTFYLRQALVPVTADDASRWFIQADTLTGVELPSAKLDDYDAVILADVTDVSPATADALVQYVSRGGGLLVFPGPDTRPELLTRELAENRPLLPAALSAPVGDTAAEKPLLTLSTRDLEHPIVQLWKDLNAGNLSNVGFYRYFPLKLAAAAPSKSGSASGAARTVLSFSDGKPAIAERTLGQGRTILFAFPATALSNGATGSGGGWSDLPVRPGIFVPLLYRSLGAVVGRQDEQLNLRVGTPFTYRPPNDWIGHEALIYSPGQDRSQPSNEVKQIELSNGQPQLSYDRTDHAGVYAIRVPGVTAASGGGGVSDGGEANTIALKFAATRSPAESSIETLGQAERAELARHATLIDYNSPESLSRVTRARAGSELWLPLTIIVLLLALSESTLAFFFSRPR
jgi:hypothetical protein